MKKEVFIYFIVFLLLISFSFSLNDIISSSTYKDYDNIAFMGKDYEVHISRDSVLLYRANGSFSIGIKECHKATATMICFDEMPDNSSATLTIKNIVYSLQSSYLNTLNFEVGYKQEVLIKLLNLGNVELDKVYFSQAIPSGLHFDNVKGCSVNNNQIYWQGHLDVNSTKSCSYYVYSYEPLSGKIESKLSYYKGSEKVDLNISDIIFDVAFPFNISYILPKKIFLGQNFSLEMMFGFSNNSNASFDIDLKAKKDFCLKGLSKEFLSFDLNSSQKKSFMFKAIRPGRCFIEIKGSYKKTDTIEKKNFVKRIYFEISNPLIQVNITNINLSYGISKRINISYRKINPYLRISTPLVAINSELFKEEFKINRPPLLSAKIINHSKDYNMACKITYQDEFGKNYMINLTWRVFIKAFNKTPRITIGSEYDDSMNTNNITVIVNNTFNFSLNISYIDSAGALNFSLDANCSKIISRQTNATEFTASITYCIQNSSFSVQKGINLELPKQKKAGKPDIQKKVGLNKTPEHIESGDGNKGINLSLIIFALLLLVVLFGGAIAWKKHKANNLKKYHDLIQLKVQVEDQIKSLLEIPNPGEDITKKLNELNKIYEDILKDIKRLS